jgi:hypothetical protein
MIWIQDYVQHLEREAYLQWDNLTEADEFDANVALIRSKITCHLIIYCILCSIPLLKNF